MMNKRNLKPAAYPFVVRQKLLGQVYEALSPPLNLHQELWAKGVKTPSLWPEFEASLCANEEERRQLLVYEQEYMEFQFVSLGYDYDPRVVDFLDSLRPWWKARWDCPAGWPLLEQLQTKRRERFLQLRQEEYFAWRAQHPFDEKYCASFSDYFLECLLQTFSKFGFTYDAARSSPDFPVVSKEIRDGWVLCWSMENASMLRRVNWEDLKKAPYQKYSIGVDMSCYVRINKGRRKVTNLDLVQRDGLIFLKIDRLIRDLGWAFLSIFEYAELDFCVHAYGLAYEIFAGRLEKILSEILPEV